MNEKLKLFLIGAIFGLLFSFLALGLMVFLTRFNFTLLAIVMFTSLLFATLYVFIINKD